MELQILRKRHCGFFSSLCIYFVIIYFVKLPEIKNISKMLIGFVMDNFFYKWFSGIIVFFLGLCLLPISNVTKSICHLTTFAIISLLTREGSYV